MDGDARSNSDDSFDFDAMLDENNPDYPSFDEIMRTMNLDLEAIEKAVYLGEPIVLRGSRSPSPFREGENIICNSTSGSEPYNTDEEREKDAEYAKDSIILNDIPEEPSVQQEECLPDLPGKKSVRTILKEKLDILSDGIKISRVVYLFKYKSGFFDVDIGENMTALVNDLNIHLGKDKLTGVLIYTELYGISMVEGSEYAITNHLKGIMNTTIRERFTVTKVLVVAPHVLARWVQNWTAVVCTLPFSLPDISEPSIIGNKGESKQGDTVEVFTNDMNYVSVSEGNPPKPDAPGSSAASKSQVPDKSTGKTPDKTSDKIPDKSSNKIPDKSTDKTPQKGAENANNPPKVETTQEADVEVEVNTDSKLGEDMEPLDDDLMVVYRCEVVWKYIAYQQMNNKKATHIPKNIQTKLPTQDFLEKCLSESKFLTLERYTDMIQKVPEFQDFHEHNTPAQGDEIPMNILNPFPGEEEVLMESMIEQKQMEKEAKNKKTPSLEAKEAKKTDEDED